MKANGPRGNSLCAVSGAASELPFMEVTGLLELVGDGRGQCCFLQLLRPFADSQTLAGPWQVSQNKGGSPSAVPSQL